MKLNNIVLALILATTATVSHAWEISTFLGNSVGWSSANPTLRYSGVSFPSGSNMHQGLDTVMFSRWNRNPSDLNISVLNNDFSVSHGNFQNETWLENATVINIFGIGAINLDPPAECWNWALGAGITEADVVFYQPFDDMPEPILSGGTPPDWNTDNDIDLLLNYGGSERPFEATAMHEFGHFIGLNHENDEYNIMGEDWTHIHYNNDTARSYPGEDASDGAVEIYTIDGSAGQDVSVVHFEWTGGRDGEYSIHNFTDLRNTSGGRLPNTPSGVAYKTYTVSPGQEVQVEFSLENNGRSGQSPEVGFYISGNDNITTSDDLITTRSPTVNRNSVYTRTYTITLPSTLTVGNVYHLGAYIDHNDVIDEFDEVNNKAHFKISVQ